MPLHATCILLLTKLYIVSSMYATTCNMYHPPHKAIYSVIHVCHYMQHVSSSSQSYI